MFKKPHKSFKRNPSRPQRQTTALEMLESRTLYSIIELGPINELINLRNDNVELVFNANGTTSVLDNGNNLGSTSGHTFSLSSMDFASSITLDNAAGTGNASITLNGASQEQINVGNNKVVLENSLFSHRTLYMPANGNDTVSIGADAHGLAGLAGWTVSGGKGTALNITDINNPSANYTITSNSVGWEGGAGVIYSGIGSLQLSGTTGNASYDVQSTSVPTKIYAAGTGIDMFTVGTGKLSLLPASLSISGGSGTNALIIDDSQATYTGGYTLTGNSLSHPSFGGLTYSGMQSLDLLGGEFASDYNVVGSPVNATITLGNGNLSSITKGVTVTGDVHLMLDDHLDSAATYTITGNSVTRSGFGGLTYSKLASLDLLGSHASDIFGVNGTSTPTVLDGSDGTDDTFYLNSESNAVTLDGAAYFTYFYIGDGNLGLLSGPVTVNNSAGRGGVAFLEDKDGSFMGGYHITADSLTRAGFGGLTYFNTLLSVLGAPGDGGPQYYDVTSTSGDLDLWGNTGQNVYVLDGGGDGNLSDLPEPIFVYGGLGGANSNNIQLFVSAGNNPNELTYTAVTGGENVAGPSGFGGVTYYVATLYPFGTLT